MNLTEKGESVAAGPTPPDLRRFPEPALGPPVVDLTPEGSSFGDVLVDAHTAYNKVCGLGRHM